MSIRLMSNGQRITPDVPAKQGDVDADGHLTKAGSARITGVLTRIGARISAVDVFTLGRGAHTQTAVTYA